MDPRRKVAETPKPRAEPPSAVKNVEESRQQRQQRAQARFRDRGGIFVPTNRTTLVDILLGKKEASPKKSRRSRSRSVSPHKQPASPTTGRGKRISLISSAAIAAGEISLSQSELRRSPRKKSTAASHRSSTSHKKTEPNSKKNRPLKKDHEVGTPAAQSTTQPRKRKVHIEAVADSQKEPTRTSGNKAKGPGARATKGDKAKAPPKARRKEGIEEQEASTSRLSSRALRDDADVPAKPSKGRAKSTNPKARSKSFKAAAPTDDDDDIPLAALKTSAKTAKRKLSIVAEESDEDEDDPPAVTPAKLTRQLSPSPSPPPPLREPSRKKQKVVPEPAPPPPVKKSTERRATAQRAKAKAPPPAKKSYVFSEDESDLEPPLPKSLPKKATPVEDGDNTKPAKRTTKGKGKAIVESDVDDDEPVPPKKSAKGKGKATAKIDVHEDEPVAVKKPAAQKAHQVHKVEPSHPGGKKKGKDKLEEDPQVHIESEARKPKGKGKDRQLEEEDVDAELAAVPKESKLKGNASAHPPTNNHDDDAQAPAKTSRKRPAATHAEEDLTPTKRVKTLPLQEVDEQSPPAKRKAAKEKKAPAKSKPAFKTNDLKMKENPPECDYSDGSPAKRTRSRTKPNSQITGPRKSVMVRMKEPLPPIEDNDPDPIDFLS